VCPVWNSDQLRDISSWNHHVMQRPDFLVLFIILLLCDESLSEMILISFLIAHIWIFLTVTKTFKAVICVHLILNIIIKLVS
jgi:hypothetical protein